MPPVITPIYPLPGATITDSLATFRVRIEDAFTSLSSYDLDADFATAFNSEAAPQYFYNPTLLGGNPLGREETVYVTITAADDAARCGVNETELSYWFIVDAIGPRVENLDTVVGVYTSCANRCIGFELTDMLGVN